METVMIESSTVEIRTSISVKADVFLWIRIFIAVASKSEPGLGHGVDYDNKRFDLSGNCMFGGLDGVRHDFREEVFHQKLLMDH